MSEYIPEKKLVDEVSRMIDDWEHGDELLGDFSTRLIRFIFCELNDRLGDRDKPF